MAKKLKIGVIGTGGISGLHLSGYQKSGVAEIVALADVNDAALAQRAQQNGVPSERCFKNHRDLLKIKDIDAVSGATVTSEAVVNAAAKALAGAMK